MRQLLDLSPQGIQSMNNDNYDDIPVPSKEPEAESQTGSPNVKLPSWLTFIFKIVFGALLAWAIWYFYKEGQKRNFGFIPKQPFGSTSAPLTLIDSKNDISLFMKTIGGKNQIFIKRNDEDFRIDISREDESGHNPSISTNGTYISYISEKNQLNEIVFAFVALGKEKQTLKPLTTINPSEKMEEYKRNILKNTHICKWTELRWHPKNEDTIAFFACNDKEKKSYPIVADLKSEKIIWANFTLNTGENRKLFWLNYDTVVFSIENAEPITEKVTFESEFFK